MRPLLLALVVFLLAALQFQVQRLKETMLHGEVLQAVEFR